MSTFTANAQLTAYSAITGTDGRGRDAVAAVSLAPVGGIIDIAVSTPGSVLSESLTRRGVAFELAAEVGAVALGACGISPAARDRVQIATAGPGGEPADPAAYTVTDVVAPEDPGLGGAISAWTLVLTRGGGDTAEATP